MKIEELLARLDANASALAKPVAVEIPNVGTMYVRRRTVLEYEQMATLKTQAEAGKLANGLFAPSVARLLCDENGNRFDAATEDALTQLLSRQPEEVFHIIVNASDGVRKVEEPTAEEKQASAQSGEEPIPN